ncbi:serine/threonine protein phosphatase [Candidatus Dependentiae bacterium]|nr:serine/threonine protein phosphatase [Candidatus Dependentiae bacterium]
MKRKNSWSGYCLIIYFGVFCVSNKTASFANSYVGSYPTLSDWIDAFKCLPKNRAGADPRIHSGFHRCGEKDKQWQEFENVLNAWLAMKKNGALFIDKHWLSKKYEPSFFDTIFKKNSFISFAQKLLVMAGTEVYIHGDLHGDIFSLLEELKALKADGIIDDNFEIIKPNVYLLFLGDYVDRGDYGLEVIYTLLRLSLANSDNIILMRGNHENISISSHFGFKDEVKNKFFDLNGDKYLSISKMNDFLPVVFYLGCFDDKGFVSYIQFCHGGIEEEFHPQNFLDDRDVQYQLFDKQSKSDGHQKKSRCGFMWNDFTVLADKNNPKEKHFEKGRGCSYDESSTIKVLVEQSSTKSFIRGIIRGHQHGDDDMMKALLNSNGVYSLWRPYETSLVRSMDSGLVWTFNVSPDNLNGKKFNFDFDTYALLKVATHYSDWKMTVYNTEIYSGNKS